MSDLNKYRQLHAKVITNSGGLVSGGLFVMRTGVLITKRSHVTTEAKNLFDILNIDDNASDTEQHAEFNSRLTYLSFKEEKTSSKNYNHKMIHEFGHRSVYNDEVVTLLIAGCSVETMLEFIAHNEATVARLTSSKTKAQDQPLYKIRTRGISPDSIELQKNIVKEHIAIKKQYQSYITNESESELFNVLTLGNKAVSFTITMSLKDWHKTLIGRLSHHGVEAEMLEILEDVSDLLNKEYDFFFNTKEEYYAMNNSDKYNK